MKTTTLKTHILSFIIIHLLSTYAVNAQDPAFDDFERTGGLGSGWTIYFGGSDINIIADSDIGITNGPTRFGIAAWTGSTFTPDQFSEAMISPDKIDSMLTQVFVRRRTSDNARYGFHWGDDNTQPMWAIKYDGVPTAQTRILDSLPDPVSPAPGDTLRIEVRTDTVTGYPEIKGYHNGILKVSAIDTAGVAIMNGEAGVVFRFRINFPASWPSKVFEEWGGGSLPPLTTGITENSYTIPWTLYPNPFGNSATLTFENSESKNYTLTLYDTQGRLVRTITDIATGQLVIERQQLMSGHYIFQLHADRQAHVKGKLMVE